ncbi:MAG: hypothetical protein ABH826_03865 [Patescibacteria group bacterium]|nr:hypothetical protein [Patescibacteria group bacterium]
MKAKIFAAYAAVNVLYVLFIGLAYLLSEVLYSSVLGNGSIGSSILSVAVGTLILFLPLVWVMNTFVLKPDWTQSFVKLVWKQTVLLTVFFVFLILALISSSARHVDIAQPIILLIVSIFAGGSIKGVTYFMKKQNK